jgi:hypothetical protein
MRSAAFIFIGLLVATGCGGSSPGPGPTTAAGGDGDSGGGSGGTSGGQTGGAGTASTGGGGKQSGGGSGNNGGTSSTTGGKPQTGDGGMVANGGVSGDRPPAKGTPGVWEDVTSDVMDPGMFQGDSFGAGNIVTDPARPTDMYVGGYGAIYKSTDYGLTWKKLESDPEPPELPLGHVLAVAGTTPATLWMANVDGEDHVYRSKDGGKTFDLTGKIPERPGAGSLYSIVVDPGNANHLITGLHEEDGILESNDAGDTWHFVTGNGFPNDGVSWFPFFIDTGDATTTSKTWFAIAQDGGSAIRTEDGGETWVRPSGVNGLEHPHGGSQLYQNGKTLFIAGYNGPGAGVYRSTDLGKTWKIVSEGNAAIVWGSSKNVYAMWGWACGGCSDGAGYQTAPQPGDKWSEGTVPAKLNWGPNSVATTSDGTHTIFVGSMWATGLWRYVEP